MKRAMLIIFAVTALLAGCITTGRDFPADSVKNIVNGKTTKEEMLNTFGPPVQKGLEDGRETWTYYRIRHRPTGKTESKELHVVFDSRGRVESYSFTETAPKR